jgi:hypothetical protein
MSLLDLLIGRSIATTEERAEHVGLVAYSPVFGLDTLSSAAYGPLLAGIAIWMDRSVQKIVIEGPYLKAKILVSDLLFYAFFIGRVLKSRIVYRPGLITNSIDGHLRSLRILITFLFSLSCDMRCAVRGRRRYFVRRCQLIPPISSPRICSQEQLHGRFSPHIV